MANTLGSLIVRLGLDAAEFTSGLTRSEYQARKFAQQIDSGIKTAVSLATIALAGMATAASAAFVAVDQLAKQAGRFQDLAEKTGANAEALASFSVAAQVAGSNIEEVANFSIKLSKNLAGVDDESKAAGAALTALGIPIKEFKELKPEQQIERLAKALGTFSDIGGGKAAVLEAIAKGGAQLLPFLKELEQQGGRQVILTAEQIRQADEYADKQARAKAELNLYAQSLATQALPAITVVTEAAKDFIKQLLGMEEGGNRLKNSTALQEFARTTVEVLASVVDIGDGAIRVFHGLGIALVADVQAKMQLATGNVVGAVATIRKAFSDLDDIARRKFFSANVAERFAAADRNASLNLADTFASGNAPPPNILKFSGAAQSSRAAAERTSEAQRYAEQLEKQLQGTLELNIVEQAEVVIWELQRSALSGLTKERADLIRDYAAQILAAQQLKKATEEKRRADEAAMKMQQLIEQTTARAVFDEQRHAQASRESNESLREQLIFLRDGQAALDIYTQAKLSKAAAELMDKAAAYENLGANEELVKAIRDQAAAIKERQALIGQISIAEQMAKEAKAIQAAQESIFDIGSRALEDMIVNGAKASDVLKQLEKDILRFLTQQALMQVKNNIFGGASSGTDIFSLIAKFGMSYFGGGTGVGGFETSGGFGAGEGFASGTNNARRGLHWVGEKGPELMRFRGGEQVISNRRTADYGMAERSLVIQQSISVQQGGNTQSAMQVAAMLRDATFRAVKNRN